MRTTLDYLYNSTYELTSCARELTDSARTYGACLDLVDSTVSVVKNCGQYLSDNTIGLFDTRAAKGLDLRNIQTLEDLGKNIVSFMPVASIAVAGAVALGVIAYGAYRLCRTDSAPVDEEDKGVKEQLDIIRDGMEKVRAKEILPEVKQQINRHVALRDKYREICRNTSIKNRIIYTVAATAVALVTPLILGAATGATVAGTTVAAVAGSTAIIAASSFLLTRVASKGLYMYLASSQDKAVRKLREEHCFLLASELSIGKEEELNAVQEKLDEASENQDKQGELIAKLQHDLEDNESLDKSKDDFIRYQAVTIADLNKRLKNVEQSLEDEKGKNSSAGNGSLSSSSQQNQS